MANIISFINHKGGVGKTTTSLNVGASLALHHKKKILLIDLDPQANLSQSLGIREPSENTIYNSLVYETQLPIINVSDNFEIAPSHLDLSAAEIELQNEVMREFILKERIEPVKNKYDYILIDCPPSLGLLTINAMAASNYIVIPVQSEFLALQGTGKLIFAYEKVKRKISKELQLLGIVLTRYDSRKNLSKETEITVNKYFEKDVFITKIRDNVSLAEAPSNQMHIFNYAPKSNGAEDYKSLSDELLKRIKQQKNKTTKE